MSKRVNTGYWDANYWPTDYWDTDYWPAHGVAFVPKRLANGYWNANYWPGSYWDTDYWAQWGSGAPTAGLRAFSRIPGIRIVSMYIHKLRLQIKIP